MTTADDPSGGALLDDQLLALAERGASGVLDVGEVGRVWLHDGRIYLVEVATGPPLAEVIYGADVGELDELRQAVSTGEDVGSRLVSQHPASKGRLERVLHEFGLNGLFELAVSPVEDFRFDEGEVHPLGPRFAAPADELLDQVRRRVAVWRNIAARIPSTAVQFRLAPVLPGDERVITADEWVYLALLDGRRTVADVVEETDQSAFRVTSALYRLLLEELIEEA